MWIGLVIGSFGYQAIEGHNWNAALHGSYWAG
jgi:hypothetical protein